MHSQWKLVFKNRFGSQFQYASIGSFSIYIDIKISNFLCGNFLPLDYSRKRVMNGSKVLKKTIGTKSPYFLKKKSLEWLHL